MKLIMQFPPVFCYFFPLRFKFSGFLLRTLLSDTHSHPYETEQPKL